MKMIWHFVHRTMPGSREPYQLVLHALLLLNHLLRIYSDFDIKLSATGLVYRHYGKDVICELYPALKSEPAKVRFQSVLGLKSICTWSGTAFSLRSVLGTGALLRRQLALKKKVDIC